MTTVRNPAPVDVPTQTTTIPLSQIDRAPAPVSAASDPSITGSGTSTVTTPPVSEQSVDPTGATIGGGTGVVSAAGFISSPVLLANLTAVAGSRAFASDANLVAAGNFGQQVSGGASNTVPVWSDGTNWYIG